MTTPLVLLERVGPAAVLTLDRAEKRNALSRALVAALGARLAEAVADPAVRAILLTARGPAFCAGLDLDELGQTMALPNPRDRMQHDARQLAAVYRALASSPKPTVAAVNGPAVAGGAGLVTACDLAVGVPAARFGYPEVRRGIVPAIVTPLLQRRAGDRAARYLLLTGDLVDAAEAARMGIYNAVVSEDRLIETARRWCDDIARGAPGALAATKQWIGRSGAAQDFWVESADSSAAARFTAECEEGLAAFREKRQPGWVPPGL